MKVLRFVLVLAVIAYAGWLAWPFLSPFFEGASPDAAAMRAGAEAGVTGGGLPTAALWIGAVVLYLIAAMMLGSGNPRAAVAYFLGFIADAVLRLAIDRQGDSGAASTDIAARSAEAVAPAGLPVDPVWLVLGALFVIGLLVVVASRRQRRKRVPGQLSA